MNAYVSRMLKKNCYSELHELFVETANPAKEITESYAAYENLLSVIGWEEFNKFVFLHIGDGSRCTTGTLFSFMSGSTNFSIDPKINREALDNFMKNHEVRRFDRFIMKWEEYKEKYSNLRKDLHLGLIMVHSHVNVKEIMRSFPKWEYVYVNPCCFPEKQTLSIQEQKSMNVNCVLSGKDNYIMSMKNEVFIYKNMNNLIQED